MKNISVLLCFTVVCLVYNLLHNCLKNGERTYTGVVVVIFIFVIVSFFLLIGLLYGG